MNRLAVVAEYGLPGVAGPKRRAWFDSEVADQQLDDIFEEDVVRRKVELADVDWPSLVGARTGEHDA